MSDRALWREVKSCQAPKHLDGQSANLPCAQPVGTRSGKRAERPLYVNLTPNRPTSGLSLDRYADLPISVVSEIAVIDSSRSREKQRIWKKWIYGRRMTPPRGPASSMPSRVPVERRNETKWLVSPREGAHNCHSLGQNGNPA